MKQIIRNCITALFSFACIQGIARAEQPQSALGLEPRAISNILKNCGDIQSGVNLKNKYSIKNDHFGRPATISTPNGLEYVIQYATDKDQVPSVIVGNGVYEVLDNRPPSREKVEKYLADRLRLYRMVKSICSNGTVGPNTDKTASLINSGYGGGSWDEGIPAEYYDSGFWEASWTSSFYSAAVNAAAPFLNNYKDWAAREAERRAACMGSCNNACDTISEGVAAVGCSAVGYALLEFGFTAKEGALVLGACATGTWIGKNWCKFKTCPDQCGG